MPEEPRQSQPANDRRRRTSFVEMMAPRPGRPGISRRAFLSGSAGVALGGAGLALGARDRNGRRVAAPAADRPVSGPLHQAELTAAIQPNSTQLAALEVLGRDTLRLPGSVPDPSLAAGTDTLPGIDHIVVLMLENHSFDNILGMLGRGDGWPLGLDGLPRSTNPYGDGRIQHAFHMPTTCQLSGTPSQEWQTSNLAYDNGKMDGFVSSPVSPLSSGDVGGVAMGYWTGDDLSFTYSLASTFPIADRWFCSLLGQTDPNRRYLISATSSGMTDDIGEDVLSDVLLLEPVPTIFDVLAAHGVSWADYTSSFPSGTTAELDPVLDLPGLGSIKSIDEFFSDAAAGNLPGFCIVEPDYSTQSQEDPQNIVVGEAFAAQVITALGSSPQWSSSLLVLNYDEHGGYYDHVPPPVALAPDLIPPIVVPGESTYEGFERYGFRVPAVLVSPYAKSDHVSHVVYDHTSVLALVERKWNLPALTLRDANANDLTDLVDMDALAAREPTFPGLPTLAAPGDTPAVLACSTIGPGTIPPVGSVTG